MPEPVAAAQTNAFAKAFKDLHVPGNPVVLVNVYDPITAGAVAGVSSCKALASASFAIAQTHGLKDEELDLETNIAAVQRIAEVARQHNKPLTVDLQDGYGDRLEEAIDQLSEAGVAGINLEDYDNSSKQMMGAEEAASRVKRALARAASVGVAEFVVNARCDSLLHGGELAEVVQRGKLYLAAGATTVFVWGGAKRGLSRSEVEQLSQAFGGKLNVKMQLTPDGLNTKELAKIGVARISIGPQLQKLVAQACTKEAESILNQE